MNYTTQSTVSPKPTQEQSTFHGLIFYYNKSSLEIRDCYCMPLTQTDVEDIQKPAGLAKLEYRVASLDVTTSRIHNHTNPSTTITTPAQEHFEFHALVFHYNKYSLEHLLIVHDVRIHDCYCMPLTQTDIEDIQTPVGLARLEEQILAQISSRQFTVWTQDDLAVRDSNYGNQCKGHVFRVYRL